jgi:hypothetical protein
MTRMRTHRSEKYFSVSNESFQTTELSFEQMGLLAHCLSMPINWEFYPKVLWKQGRCSRDAIYKNFNRLIETFHCIRIFTANPKFPNLPGEVSYEVFDDKEDCKKRILELQETEKHLDHGYNFKKSFLRPEGQYTEAQYTGSQDYIKETDNTKETNNTNICADSVDAPIPEIPKKSLKKEKPVIEKVLRRELVQTSEEEHEKLIKKYGKELTEQCYDFLNEWKKSKKEAEPKAVDKHTCYYRITKWVAKEVKIGGEKQKLNDTREWEKTNREFFFNLKKKHFNEMKEIEYANGFILNRYTGKDVSIKMNPQSFKIALGHVIGAEYNGR